LLHLYDVPLYWGCQAPPITENSRRQKKSANQVWTRVLPRRSYAAHTTRV
jgi:hypothetical protein